MLLFSIGLFAVSLTDLNLGHLATGVIALAGLFYYVPFVYYEIEIKILSNLI